MRCVTSIAYTDVPFFSVNVTADKLSGMRCIMIFDYLSILAVLTSIIIVVLLLWNYSHNE